MTIRDALLLAVYPPAIFAAILLAGCTTTATVACPPLRAYGTAFNMQLADEVAAAPGEAAWPTVIEDYISLRDQIKAACP